MQRFQIRRSGDLIQALGALVLLAILLFALPTRAGEATSHSHDLNAIMSSVEGVFATETSVTPFGSMPMAFHFQREEDGSLHAHTAQSPNTWIDLRFRSDDEGKWYLDEAASMPGLGVQEYTLELVGSRNELLEWRVPSQPDLMTVYTSVSPEFMTMRVVLRGEEHVVLEMARLEGEAAEQLAAQLAAVQGERPASK